MKAKVGGWMACAHLIRAQNIDATIKLIVALYLDVVNDLLTHHSSVLMASSFVSIHT